VDNQEPPGAHRNLPPWLLRELEHPVTVCPHCDLDGFHGSLAECVHELRRAGRDAGRKGQG
jgi:hypothetical protein